MNEHPNLIRDVSQWLIHEIYDEVSDVDLLQMEPTLATWLTGFSYQTRNERLNHRLLQIARREADAYYHGHIQQKFHTWQDKVHFMMRLTRALLMARGWYDRFLTDDPLDFFRADAMHIGHYVNLTDGITRMFSDMGTKERQPADEPKIWRIYDPFLPLN